MHYQKGYTIIELIIMTAFVVIVSTWFINLMRLTGCDFKSGANTDWKCEAIHGIGLIPVVAPFTAWFSSDKE